jgi:hypothetical protein
VANFYPMWAGKTVFAVRLYLPAHAAEVLAREVDTPDPGPVYLVIMLRLPWGQVGVGVIVTGVNRALMSGRCHCLMYSSRAVQGSGGRCHCGMYRLGHWPNVPWGKG